MRPLKLILEGFTGVRDGMKRESVMLDLETLPDGLIALVGPNGAGKTTIMDNLHPYRIMPSRASKLSVDAFSYWDHLCNPNALKELEWEHEDIRYRSSFAFRKPGKVGKAEYYLAYRSSDGVWRPVTLPDGTTSDGKSESYDLCVQAVCGSLETFFTSVFSAQNRRPLASYGAGEIKTLLAEMLGIEHLKALSAKAGEVAKLLGRALESVQSELSTFGAKRELRAQAEQHIASDGVSLAAARNDREAAISAASKLTQERATLVARQSASASTEARLRELGVRRSEVSEALSTLTRGDADARKRVDARRVDLNRAIAGHEATLKQRDAILAAATQRDDIQIQLAREEEKVEPLQKLIADMEAKQLSLTDLRASLKGLETEGAAKAAHSKGLSEQAAVVGAVPCAGHAMHATCPLLAQAHAAKAEAEVQRISVVDLRAKYREKKEQAEVLNTAVVQLTERRAELKALTDAIARSRRALQAAIELGARKPLLDAAAVAVTTSYADLKVLSDEEVARAALFKADTARLDATLAEVQTEVQRLAAVDVTAEIAAVDRQLFSNREAVVALEARIESLIRSQTTAQAQAEALAKEFEGLSATEHRAQRLSDEIAPWKLLAKCLGNDGVVALTIDDAGPALTNTVNELLLACYGMRFAVEIRTQRALATGELREGFEIIVHDADNDSSKSVSVMSGGQKVWINECLTRGIALYLAQNTGQPYQTLFSDESDGPLDEQRKVQFMRMKREVLRQGGYQREFFISQTPDLVALADAVIDVQALAA
jgi:exonuclease SbcC